MRRLRSAFRRTFTRLRSVEFVMEIPPGAHHVVVISSNPPRIFVDGREVREITFPGQVAGLAIYKQRLIPEQITAHSAAARAPHSPTEGVEAG